jgi:hypothetical protein
MIPLFAEPGYRVDFQQDINSTNNSYDIAYYKTNVSLGQVQILPNDYYYAHPTEWVGGPFTLVISSPMGNFDMFQMANQTNSFPTTVKVLKGGVPVASGQTTSPYVLELPNQSLYYSPVYQFRLDIQSHPGRPNPLRGNYYSVIKFELYKDYGTENQQLLDEKIYNIYTHYVSTDSELGSSITTDLVVDRYATASDIDLPSLQNSGGSLKVGSVSFFSNDSSDTSTYAISVSPVGDPLGPFTFIRSGGTTITIPYKVFIPSKPVLGSQRYAFTVPIETKSISGVWQDSFELGITQINYDSVQYATGEYTSNLQIELISE